MRHTLIFTRFSLFSAEIPILNEYAMIRIIDISPPPLQPKVDEHEVSTQKRSIDLNLCFLFCFPWVQKVQYTGERAVLFVFSSPRVIQFEQLSKCSQICHYNAHIQYYATRK